MDRTNAKFFINEIRIYPRIDPDIDPDVVEGNIIPLVLTKDYEKGTNFTITIGDSKLPPPTLFNDIDGNLQLNSFGMEFKTESNELIDTSKP